MTQTEQEQTNQEQPTHENQSLDPSLEAVFYKDIEPKLKTLFNKRKKPFSAQDALDYYEDEHKSYNNNAVSLGLLSDDGVIMLCINNKTLLLKVIALYDVRLSKQPSLNYLVDTDLKLNQMAIFNAEYLYNFMAIAKKVGETVTINLKRNYPLTIELRSDLLTATKTEIKFILAPRVEND
jgi:hypothetical protein